MKQRSTPVRSSFGIAMGWIAPLATIVCAGCAGTAAGRDGLAWGTGEAWTRIAELEDARTTGGGAWIDLLASDDAALRARVATALGRMPLPDEGAEVTRALLEALFDPDAGVRAAAAFALGMRGDPSAADKLVFVALDNHEADADPLVRARAIEAASKLDRPELRARLLDGLLDSDPRVRLEAAQGASRWPADAADASTVNQRLVDHLANETDGDVITYTLFALERRKAIEAADVFVRFAESDEPEQRLFAVRGLKALAPAPGVVEALLAVLAPAPQQAGDFACATEGFHQRWRERCEALLALGAFDDARAMQATAACTLTPAGHVARTAWEAVGAQLERAREVPRELVAANASSPSVRAAQLEALARGISTRLESIPPPIELGGPLEYIARANLKDTLPSDVYSLLQDAITSDDHVVRTGAARAAAHLPSRHAMPFLERLAHDPHPSVAGAAIEGFAKTLSDTASKTLHDFLAHPDNGLRLAAVTALAEMPDASDLAPLKRAFDTSTGDGAVEVRFNVLRNVAKIGGDEALAIEIAAFADPHPFVRRVAREEVARAWPELEVTRVAVDIPPRAPAQVPVAGVDFPCYEANPRVEVVTSRGTMTFELFPHEAPVHVHNFLTLAARDHYDGLIFHRVVPDFVIQGGDYRGDGNGGGTWRGREDSLRHEITPRKYVRGSLGMPRNEDFESGGSQFFVTHRPTPHLDGRYTIFGELREGFEVLDLIEVGDTIVDVRVR